MNTSSTQKQGRILWIDILRGLMMFLVIYGHASCNNNIKKFKVPKNVQIDIQLPVLMVEENTDSPVYSVVPKNLDTSINLIPQ